MRAKRVRALKKEFQRIHGRPPAGTEWEITEEGYHVTRSEARALKRGTHRAPGLDRPRLRRGVPEVEGAPKAKLTTIPTAAGVLLGEVDPLGRPEFSAAAFGSPEHDAAVAMVEQALRPKPQGTAMGTMVVGRWTLPAYLAEGPDERRPCERCEAPAAPLDYLDDDGDLEPRFVFTDPVVCDGCRAHLVSEIESAGGLEYAAEDDGRPCERCKTSVRPMATHNVTMHPLESGFYWPKPTLCFSCRMALESDGGPPAWRASWTDMERRDYLPRNTACEVCSLPLVMVTGPARCTEHSEDDTASPEGGE